MAYLGIGKEVATLEEKIRFRAGRGHSCRLGRPLQGKKPFPALNQMSGRRHSGRPRPRFDTTEVLIQVSCADAGIDPGRSGVGNGMGGHDAVDLE
jgi:hypothetical protein